MVGVVMRLPGGLWGSTEEGSTQVTGCILSLSLTGDTLIFLRTPANTINRWSVVGLSVLTVLGEYEKRS